MKGQGIIVKYLRCDNAGEQGKKLAEFCKAHGIQIEYTAPNTPQQNGIVERKIAMDCDCAYAMLLAARLTKMAQNLLRAEAESAATKLSNMAWNQQVKGVPNDLFDGKPGQLHPGQLIEFGRAGYVTIQKQIKTKWEDKSTKCIMVGYADDHSGDTYCMYNPVTNHVRLTRDVCWAAWTRTNPTEVMKIFEQTTGTKPMTTAGASTVDDLPMTTILLDNDEDVLHDKVGRIETPTTNVNNANTNPTPNVITTNVVQRTIPTRSTVRTGTAPAPARHVQFHDTDIQWLTRKLRALQFGTHETETTRPEAVETNEPKEQKNSAFKCYLSMSRITRKTHTGAM